MGSDLPAAGVAVFACMLAIVFSTVLWAGHTNDHPGPDSEGAVAMVPPPPVTVHMKDLKYSPLTLTIPVGTTVTWVNDDPFAHTVTPANKALWGTDGSGDDFADWIDDGESWSYTFNEVGGFSYYCIPHASQDADGNWKGMIGTVIVTEDARPPTMSEEGATLPVAMPVDVAEIGRDAADVPPPVSGRAPTHLYFNITASEVIGQMADGTTYSYWTFDNTVPGPMLRARVGDTMTINLTNDPGNTMGHDIDFHAVTGPGGGAPALGVAPGETVQATFKLLNPGLFVYHCAYQDPPLHIAHGMYGQILVEPAGGLPPVDREYYVMQGDFYSPYTAADKGHHDYDGERAAREDPAFVVFNGRVGSLKDEDRQLQADIGETVRLFVGNGGPNLVSSFHVIGEIFDRVWEYGGLETAPHENVQTALIPAGGSAMVEFEVEVPGDYFLVDHSIFRVHKGAFGVLHVSGDDNSDVYRAGP